MIVLGLMSGTSLDGLDLCFCDFSGFPNDENGISWKILGAKTIEYPAEWKEKLNNAPNLSGLKLMNLHHNYGKHLGEACNSFINETGIKPDLISSHGHTVFHEPKDGFTTQIGDGNLIAAKTGINTVYDFRMLDVALGGQGAPLVPVGDEYLFKEFDACLNLGGIANISYRKNDRRVGYDISPFNLLLNKYAQKIGLEYDDNGQMASEGETNVPLLTMLRAIPFYGQKGAKSLDKEKLLKEYHSIIEEFDLAPKDTLSTLVEHFAEEISRHFIGKNCLITGGGAYNSYFIERLTFRCKTELLLPSKEIIDFKEALIFGLLGYLRINNFENTLSDVTGASRNTCAGMFIKVDP